MIVFSRTERDRRELAAMSIPFAALANDGRDYTGIVVQKPWGCEMQLRQTDDFAATRLDLQPGRETSMHCHTGKAVVLAVLRGAIRIDVLDAKPQELEQGDTALVERGVFHRLTALLGGAEVLEIEFPPNKRDLVRLSDAHGRGQGYECV